jgi:hypothetical protein
MLPEFNPSITHLGFLGKKRAKPSPVLSARGFSPALLLAGGLSTTTVAVQRIRGADGREPQSND